MAQTKYTYSIATDTANAAVDVNALQEEVRASAIVIALDFINAFGDVLDIYMKDALTAGDETILNGVVTAHTAVPLPDDFVQKVQVTANADALGASNTLKVSQIVTAGAQVADTLVVPNGQTATVKFLEASCPDSALAVVRLIWDFDGAGESDEWVFQRSNVAPSEVVFSYVGDGVKKLAVCADNSANSDYYFNAFAKVEVV
jgi:hypothetical protein